MGKSTRYGKEIVTALRCISTEGNVAPDCRGCPFYVKEQLGPEWAAKVGTDELYSCDCNAVGFAAADLIENQQNHIRALLQANDALRPAWIPVTERLPEDRSNVLAVAYWYERWGVYMAWCAPERAEWCVHVGIGDRSDVAVTHWMPLPPAPEEY